MGTLKLYDFSGIQRVDPAALEAQLCGILDEYRKIIDVIIASGSPFTWDGIILPIEDMQSQIDCICSPLAHLQMVANTDSIGEAHEKCVARMSAFSAEMQQNEDLYRAYVWRAASPEYAFYSAEQKRAIALALESFCLGGVPLPKKDKVRFRHISERLARF